jgi:PHD/YefM family antitoxin component YafN of YafNO toxin-antitoxin module
MKVKNASPVEEFTKNANAHIRRLKETGEPEVLTVAGQPEVVVQSAQAYERLLAEMDDLRAVQTIRTSYAEARRGEGRPARQVLRDIAARYNLELPS